MNSPPMTELKKMFQQINYEVFLQIKTIGNTPQSFLVQEGPLTCASKHGRENIFSKSFSINSAFLKKVDLLMGRMKSMQMLTKN
ncbi:hypothetical protein D3C86_1735090 [compost metagenome]